MENKKNCNSCKFGFIKQCDTLKNNMEYQAINEEGFLGVKRFEFKENFICDLYKSKFIEYPITVSKIDNSTDKSSYRDRDIGKLVSIRPCKQEYGGKTYLGIYLGDLPIGNIIQYIEKTELLKINFSTNPAIFVFDLNKIIYGCESWWGIISKEEELKEITDVDIDNIWYIKALKQLENEQH